MGLRLTRKRGESLMFPGQNMEIYFRDIGGGKCEVEITAPQSVIVWRKELLDRAEPRRRVLK